MDKILEALHTNAAIAPLRVMLVQPREESEIQAMRGTGRSGLNLRELYEERLIETAEVFEPDLELLGQKFVEYQPHVIHLAGTLRESSHAWEVYLEFGEGSYVRKQTYSSSITTNDINHMLKRLPDNQPRPLIILGVRRPPGTAEAARQLMLRNLFATELFHLENTGGIIAGGLTSPEMQREVAQKFIVGLGAGRSPGDALREVHRLHRASSNARRRSKIALDEALGWATTALFSNNPLLPLLARGRWDSEVKR